MKQKLDSINKQPKENVQGAKEFMEALKGGDMMTDAEDKAAVIKLKLERTFERWNELLKENKDQ